MMHLQKLTSFLLGLLFFMHALRVSSAYANQGEEGLARRGTNGGVSKGLLDGAGLRKIGLGGRKMVVQKVLRKEIERQDTLNGKAASEISGATHSDGILDLEVLKGSFKVKCKLGHNLVAFTADYHGPKRHPSKHN
ncbi:hypothetical protein CJ030_MR6G021402 [Morella rubra]|uniref:Uncharacterized protein n=1 Tax=Morella rubra TaxID=262757 RepID=A0A6A1VHW2_9ROSI|nr:hypothetical protein CJ030_MR6G021402 [Morella rubra]